MPNFDNRSPVHCVRFYGASGQVIDTATRNTGEYGSYAHSSSRPKPNPLTNTPLDLILNDRIEGGNNAEYHEPNPPGRFTIWYDGTLHFCVGNRSLTTYTESASGLVALTKAYSNMSTASFGEALAEVGQSTNMILGRIGQMAAFANNVRRGRWGAKGMKRPSKKARNTPGDRRLANNWLEFQYGWTPLMNDIYDLLKALDDGLTRRGTRVGANSSENISIKGISGQARAGLKGTVRNEGLYNLNRYGLLNPAQLAWNLLPLSFVFDWFVPVSRTLGALTGTAGLTDVSSWFTNCSLHVETTLPLRGSGPEYVYSSKKTVSRHVGSFFLPQFWIASGAVNAGRVATSVALLRQRV